MNDGNFDLILRSVMVLGLSHAKSTFNGGSKIHLYQNQSTHMNASIIHNKKYLEGDVLANPLYGQVIVSHSFIVDYVSFHYINYIRSCSNEGGRGGTDHVTQSDLDSSNKSHIFIVDTFANNKYLH